MVMRRIIFLFLIFFAGSVQAQNPFRMPYPALLHTYNGDTTKQFFNGAYYKWYTNKSYYFFDKPIYANGVLLGAGGIGSVDSTKMKSNYQARLDTIKLHNQIASVQNGLNLKQGTINLTTLGSSGAATFIGTTLNIPQYSGGSATVDTTTTGKYISKYQANKNIHDSLQTVWSILRATSNFNGSTIPFDAYTHTLNQYTVSSNLTITPSATNTFSGAGTIASFKGDGTHTIAFSGFKSINGSSVDSFINTTDYISKYAFINADGEYFYNLLNYDLAPSAAPTFVSGRVYANQPNKFKLLYNTSLYAGSVPATFDFSTSPSKTISNIALSGDTLIGTVSVPFAFGNTITVTYTPGTNGIKHTSTGASATGLTNQSLTNSVAAIQLQPMGSFAATGVSTTQINLTWTTPSPNGRNFQIYDSVAGISSNFNNLLISPAKGATSYTQTGLLSGWHVYYKGRTVGNGVDTLTSTFALTDATASALTQLSAPINGTITGLSSTGLTANVSGVDANASYLSLDYKLTSSGTWTNFSSTLARTVTSQAITGLTAGTSYDTRWTAIGNGTTYSNSNASSTVSATTWETAPTLSSAATSTDGLTVTLTFNKTMGSSPSATGFSLSPTKTISGITQSGSTLVLTVSAAFASGDAITVTYLPGTIVAGDLGVLAGFTGQAVTNNTINTAVAPLAQWTAETSSNFTLSGTNILTWLDGSGNGHTLYQYASAYKTYDAGNKCVLSNGNYLFIGQHYITPPSETINMSSASTIIMFEKTGNYSQTGQTYLYANNSCNVDLVATGIRLILPDLTNAIFGTPSANVINKQVIRRNGSSISWKVNGSDLNQISNNLSNTNFLFQGIAGVNTNIYALVIYNTYLTDAQVTSELSRLNTLLGL